MISLKRIYDPVDHDDGYRILVDRVWPRGMTKEAAHLDEWMKDLAPSSELRTWFHHDPTRFTSFRVRYEAELQNKQPLLDTVRTLTKTYPHITLLYGARDTTYNHAVILLDVLRSLDSYV